MADICTVKRSVVVLAATAALAVPWRGAADEPRGRLLPFTEGEVRAIVQHGPWPPPWSPDPGNRVSGRAEAIDFGERLFFDPRLSATGTISCATCHVPERNWTDARKLGVGLREVDRNTPSVLNVRHQRWFGWDGANDSLWAQSFRPLVDAREMGMDERRLAALVRGEADLACRYEKTFGAPLSQEDEEVMVNLGKALAAFQETLVTGRTRFDEFRDALARGDREGAARYPENAQRGARLFVGKGSCNLCHFGPAFTHGEFHEIGIPVYRKSGGVDWGRYEGIKRLRASRFSLLGRYNDDATRENAASTRHVALSELNFEQFKVPGLRNVALTAPYMHNGHLATLADVARHYSEIDLGLLHLAHLYDADGVPVAIPIDNLLKPLKLTAQEIADLVAFLETLTDADGAKPRRLPADDACDVGTQRRG